jgi:hypothetical protein
LKGDASQRLDRAVGFGQINDFDHLGLLLTKLETNR